MSCLWQVWLGKWKQWIWDTWEMMQWFSKLASPYRYPELKYIKLSEFLKSCQKFVFIEFDQAGMGRLSLCLFIDSYRFSFSLVLLYAIWTSNNKWLLMESSCFWVANTQATWFQQITVTVRSSEWIVSFLICGSFKHCMGAEKTDKQTIWKHIWYWMKR